MGILNVTPDSFSDGGLYFDEQAAIEHGLRMIEKGADWIDVGGESTRPGAEPVPAAEELERVLPVVRALANRGAKVSVDTGKAEVARAALAEGALLVNDVTALRDPEMVGVVQSASAGLCLMHMQGEPRTMQNNPHYGDVVAEVEAFLLDRAQRAVEAGVAADRIWIDPGFGFGKTPDHNLQLLNATQRLASHGYPVMIGVSRKSTLAKIVPSSGPDVADRDDAGIALQAICQVQGARIFRVHDVARTRRAVEAVSAFVTSNRLPSAEANGS